MPAADSARSALNTNDLRGKVNRIHVKDGDITAADANKADFTARRGAYTIPAGNLFPLVAGAPQAKTRPEIYAMGFRNPFRLQVDENDVAYVTDYSPDSQTPQQFHGPPGVGRVEIVRKPANYGWPYCFKPNLPEYPWNVNLQVPMNALNASAGARGPDAAAVRLRQRRPGPEQRLCGTSTAARASSPASRRRRRSRTRTSGTRTATTTRRRRSARRASPATARTR